VIMMGVHEIDGLYALKCAPLFYVLTDLPKQICFEFTLPSAIHWYTTTQLI
jgi:hypothetical protein